MLQEPVNKSFAKYQHQIIKELNAKIVDLTEQVNAASNSPGKGTRGAVKTRYWNLPYVFEVSSSNEDEIVANKPVFLYIRDDDSKGLKVPARSGYILNDGPGEISYRLNNGADDGWSHPATLKVREVDTFEYTDNIQIVTVEITADTNKTRFRTRFTPGFGGD